MSSSDTAGGGGSGSGAGGTSSLSTASVTGAKLSTSTISGTPIALTSGASTATAIRAIGAGGQTTQVRVVMPTNLITAAPSMIKQIESAAVVAAAAAAGGRTQLTAMPATASVAARSVSNASITVARPISQATYIPRASVSATQMASVATTGQRLVTPIRAAPAAAVAGGNFVRATGGTAATVSRNSAVPATTVISPATSTTWMAANTVGQVQLIRAISHQPRQRIIATQNLGNSSASGSASVVSPSAASSVLSGTVVAAASAIGGNSNQTTTGQGGMQTAGNAQSTLQSTVSVAGLTSQSQQPTYVATLATVLPPRQHQATLVYSSNVGNATGAASVAPQATQSITQTQQFSPTLATTQRFAVATSLTAAAAASNANRQLRQIPLAKPISTAKLSTASISIRAPNLPQLTPTIATATAGLATVAGSVAGTLTSGNAAVTARSATVTGIAGTTATASILPGANLSTTRIIQLQQQPGGTAQQIIGSTGRLAGNVMLQPFIVNTTGGNKIGLRPPVTMATKGQPSLTITHMGISKLPTTVSTATIAAAAVGSQPTGLQGLGAGGVGVVSTVATNLSGSGSPTVAGSIIAATPAPVATVSVAGANAAGLLAAQNIVSSAAAGVATVVPLAITTRGGTLTSIKNANGITVGKVVTPAGNVAMGDSGSNTSNPANVFMQQQQQRPGSAGLSCVSATSAVSSSNTTSSTIATSTGSSSTVVSSSTAAAFLPPGSTIYYESVPASTVQASTGVLSITTTTLSSSTMSQQQTVTAAVPSMSSTSSTSFTVVPSNSNGNGTGGGARTIGQLQPVVSSTAAMGSHLQSVRFSTPLSAASEATTAQQQVLMATQQVGGNVGQHLVIPLQTSIKVTTASGAQHITSATIPNYLRKRENVGSTDNPVRAAKNLAPTLLSMGAGSIVAAASSPSSSVSSTSSTHNVQTSAAGGAATSTATASVSQSLSPAHSTCSSFSTVSSSNVASSTLTVEALAKKDRAHAQSRSRAASPASSDGSTTVSANSSPGVEQQQMAQEESGIHHSTHFNPIHELYPTHHHQQQPQQIVQAGINVALNAPNTPQRMNGGIDGPPRKRARRGTNDSQQSNQSQPSSSFPMPAPVVMSGDYSAGNSGVQIDDNSCNNNQSSTNQQKTITTGTSAANTQPQPTGNKENAKPVEYFLRRPRNCTLLSSYKANWKSANNHFQRYTDVKQREERRPTVIDVANQANIKRKLSGWKIYHLRSLMEDVAENEEASHNHLTEILKSLEKLEKTSDTERLGDLLKGNIQRNKIIVDGMNEAKNQIMKILDHESHVSEILSRCASKRNFKKRDKV